jgi:hypothetical protein
MPACILTFIALTHRLSAIAYRVKSTLQPMLTQFKLHTLEEPEETLSEMKGKIGLHDLEAASKATMLTL